MKLNKQCNLIFVLLSSQAVTLGALEWIPQTTTIERDPFVWVVLTQQQPSVVLPELRPITMVEKHEAASTESFDWHLSAISNSNIPCALLVRDNQTMVVRVQEELGKGWKVDKISATCVICKHQSGNKKELWL